MRFLVEPFALGALERGRSIEQFLGPTDTPGQPVREEDFGLQLAVVVGAHAALAIAEGKIGADRSRWVNEGVAGAEYRDYVRAGRPSAFLGGAARSNACPE
ncbi:hypothetical protein [Streptomyces sp. NPDC051310]|uniref:hypothetical protein n=1 Tax=Streptomyces sp. NPDC051310 TaxID=3365649 RepID=UPI0037A418C7